MEQRYRYIEYLTFTFAQVDHKLCHLAHKTLLDYVPSYILVLLMAARYQHFSTIRTAFGEWRLYHTADKSKDWRQRDFSVFALVTCLEQTCDRIQTILM